jgi:hypothetical protein
MIHEKIPDSQLQEWDVEGEWGREFYKSTSQFEPCIYVRKVNTGRFLLKEKEVLTRLFAKNSGLQLVALGRQKKTEQNVEVYCACSYLTPYLTYD